MSRFEIGDVVRYAWNDTDCGIVLKVGRPYPNQDEREYLYVYWTEGAAGRNSWWVPIDPWIVKC